eukprot:9477051-Pyramimonas_sp.AAC.1
MSDEGHGKELVHPSSSSSGHQVPQPVHQVPQPVHPVPHPVHQVSQPAQPIPLPAYPAPQDVQQAPVPKAQTPLSWIPPKTVPLQATAGQSVPDDSPLSSENFDMSRALSEIMADSSRQEPDQTASMGPAVIQDKSTMEVSSQDHQMSTPASSTAVPLADVARP